MALKRGFSRHNMKNREEKFSLIGLDAAMQTRRNSKHRDRERLSERTTSSGRSDSLICKEMELAESNRNDCSRGNTSNKVASHYRQHAAAGLHSNGMPCSITKGNCTRKFSLIEVEAETPTLRKRVGCLHRKRLSERTASNGRCDSLLCIENEDAEGSRNDCPRQNNDGNKMDWTPVDAALSNSFAGKELQEHASKEKSEKESKGELFSPLLCGTIG